MFANFKWDRKTLVPDLGSGLTVALVSIPEGMAYAVVAGVNPIYGLYTGMMTTIVAALTGSTSLMVVTVTNALALVTAQQLAGLGGDADPTKAMFTLTLMVGVIMFLLGVFRLGSVIRFVSREVMAGFILATALLLVLGQVDDLVGYSSQLTDSNKLVQAADVVLHFPQWNMNTAVVGFASILVLVLLQHSPLKKWAEVLVILLAALFVMLMGWKDVELVSDIAKVPGGLAVLPMPVLPDFSLVIPLLGGAIAAATVGLAESSGVGTAYPNPDGTRSSMSKDFSAQGLGNMIGSFFQAMPAGGSLSRSGINATGGAKSRWSGVYAGLLLAIVLILFGPRTEAIPMAGLAGLLIVIGVGLMIEETRILHRSWKVMHFSVGVAVITVLLGLFASLTIAIFGGVILSLMVYAYRAANRVEVIELFKNSQGAWEERAPDKQYRSDGVTILEMRGPLYFAAIYSLHSLLPSADGTSRAAVILRMRDRASTSSLTGLTWLLKYSASLKASGNRLMITGFKDDMMDVLQKAGVVDALGAENLFPAKPQEFAATDAALSAAEAWLKSGAGKDAGDEQKSAPDSTPDQS